jgi:hypothetical protein
MIELQTIVDDIVSFLQSANRTEDDRLRQVAAKYATACEEANIRMRRCGELLKAGLHAEVVHLAEMQPRLLEIYATLDFPGREEWDEMAATYGFARAPMLLADVAEAVNRAYLQNQNLADQLQKHRSMAWGRNSVSSRLDVMRSIAGRDSAATFWDEDIRTFERHRLKEIAQETAMTTGTADRSKLITLLIEIERTTWREPVQSLRERLIAIRRDHFRSHVFDKAQSDLEAALLAKDLARGRALRNHLMKEAKQFGIPDDDPIWRQVQRPLAWLRQQDDYEAVLQALREGLDADTGKNELTNAYSAILQQGYDVPQHLEALYYKRVGELRNKSIERGLLLAVILPCLILLVILAGALFIG